MGGIGFAKGHEFGDVAGMTNAPRVPLIHITDLYHPPQDPDDQFDLATALALPELELKAVLLDVTRKFTVPAPAGWDLARDPGVVTVAQANVLRGTSIPVAIGPRDPLASTTDDVSDRPASEQAAVKLLLSTLAETAEPVIVSIVGSARIMAAAFLQAPELVKEKVASVWINAGSTVGGELEWNVALDPIAYQVLWRSGLPIRWFPCATEQGAFDPEPERGTHWSTTHAELLTGLSARWRGWFAYGLSGSARGDFLRAMDELGAGPVWENLQAARRSMWSTASLVMAAGRCLARTDAGWRFVNEPAVVKQGLEVWPWRLDSVVADVDSRAGITWAPTDATTPHRLFGRKPGRDYGVAMTEALNALLVEQLSD